MVRRRDGAKVANSINNMVGSGAAGARIEPDFDQSKDARPDWRHTLVCVDLWRSDGDVYARPILPEELSKTT